MRTNLNVKEIIELAKAIAELEEEPNIRPLPPLVKNMITGWDDEFTIDYRRTAGITEFFTHHHSDDYYNRSWLTRDLLKKVGAWNSAVAYAVSQTIMWLHGKKPELFDPPFDSPVSDLLGFSHVESGEQGGVLISLTKDKEVIVTMYYGENMKLDKFFELFLH